MANKLDKMIVIDVESTCWEEKTPNRLQESEIIEIGICVIDLLSFSIEDSQGIFVLPQNSILSPFCTNLTTITQKMLDDNGIAFSEACSLLRNKYNTNNRLWLSWGDYDRRRVERQCGKPCYQAKYPFGPTHLNVKNLFAIELGLSREVGMIGALELLGIKLEGTHHRGMDDARNIAKIACELLKPGREKLGQGRKNSKIALDKPRHWGETPLCVKDGPIVIDT